MKQIHGYYILCAVLTFIFVHIHRFYELNDNTTVISFKDYIMFNNYSSIRMSVIIILIYLGFAFIALTA